MVTEKKTKNSVKAASFNPGTSEGIGYHILIIIISFLPNLMQNLAGIFHDHRSKKLFEKWRCFNT
jgi:hypothetical protein